MTTTGFSQQSVTSLQTERRIAVFTLLFGLAASIVAAATKHRDWATGLVIGAALAWLNFRLLRRGLDALVAASTAQAGAAKPHVPTSSYFVALFRYALIALSVYVIFKFLKVPLASLVVGLCSLAIAALAASVYELIRAEK
jgi:ATP synthase I chain